MLVDIGLSVGGFVDVLLLPTAAERRPAVGTQTDFEVWWADQRHQVWLKPVDSRFLRDDFDAWQADWRPGWPEDVLVDQAWVAAAAAAKRETGVIERILREAGWHPGRSVPVDGWRGALEGSGLIRMHGAAERFLAEFGGLEVQISGPGIDVGRTSFHFKPDFCVVSER